MQAFLLSGFATQIHLVLYLMNSVTGFGLTAIWSEKMVESSLEMAELENTSPHEAEKWILFPNM